MGGAGRSGIGLRMVTKVSVGGAGNNGCQQRTVVTLSESCVWNGMERVQLLLCTLTCFSCRFFQNFAVCIRVRLHLCHNVFQVVYMRGFKHNIIFVYYYSLIWHLLFGSLHCM